MACIYGQCVPVTYIHGPYSSDSDQWKFSTTFCAEMWMTSFIMSLWFMHTF